MTRAPSRAKAAETARPSAPVPPATSAILFLKESSGVMLSCKASCHIGLAAVCAALFQELGHQCGPSRLVCGAQSHATLAVKILIEAQQIPPVRIALKFVGRSIDGAGSIFIAQEDAAQRSGEFRRNLPECQFAPRARRKLHLEFITKIVMESLQRLDDQKIDREPHRASPVRIPAKCAGARLGGLVADAVLVSHHRERVRM